MTKPLYILFLIVFCGCTETHKSEKPQDEKFPKKIIRYEPGSKKVGQIIYFNEKGKIEKLIEYFSNKNQVRYQIEIDKKTGDSTQIEYFRNGNIKTHLLYKKHMLWNIFEYNLETGKKLDYGNFKEGKGTIILYRYDSIRVESGSFIKGKKEGYWYKYHHLSDTIVDSIPYKNGINLRTGEEDNYLYF